MKDTNDTEHFQTRVIHYKVRAVSEDMKFFNSVFSHDKSIESRVKEENNSEFLSDRIINW